MLIGLRCVVTATHATTCYKFPQRVLKRLKALHYSTFKWISSMHISRRFASLLEFKELSSWKLLSDSRCWTDLVSLGCNCMLHLLETTWSGNSIKLMTISCLNRASTPPTPISNSPCFCVNAKGFLWHGDSGRGLDDTTEEVWWPRWLSSDVERVQNGKK